jgi:glycerophosphodiester phosphodiesterase
MSSDFRSSTYENFPLIGHRGSGSNKTALLNTMNISENTVLSFVTANQRGAEYVELDVQLTKDKIPIIYHDYTVSETGFNLPLSRLTLIEFLALKDNKITTPQPKTLSRSRSEHSLLEHEALKINDSFPSLKMGLLNTPTNIGFNIELKVPLEDEAEREGIPMVDLDDYGEKVLACVFANAKGRKILFSSFHPDVCSVFARKQSRYPVYLLTSAGSENHLDIRCNSLQGAVRFAKSNNLRGIVSKGEPILECPELVGIVKSLNLALITWGDENNNVSNVRLQQLLGVDAVIMDHVACVKKGLS